MPDVQLGRQIGLEVRVSRVNPCDQTRVDVRFEVIGQGYNRIIKDGLRDVVIFIRVERQITTAQTGINIDDNGVNLSAA